LQDPATRTLFSSGWDSSGIEISEGADANYYLSQNVPHGQMSGRKRETA
jgi:hypothetical protein